MSPAKQSTAAKTNGKPALGESLFALRPDPIVATPEQVHTYIGALRHAADEGSGDPLVLRAEAWEQLALLTDLFPHFPESTPTAFQRIYLESPAPGMAPTGLHRGAVGAPVGRGLEGRIFTAFTKIYLPWIGKRFDDEPGGGINVVRRSSRIPIRLIWPSYSPQEMGEGHLGLMRFHTSIEPSVVDADKQVLALDYNLPENPALAIRKVRDELVEVVPGTLLGKMLMRRGERWKPLAYFMVRRDAP